MAEIVGNFSFDCPTKAYDLSNKDWLTDDVKSDFDKWFEIAHEEMPKAPSDEEFFAKLLNPTKEVNENNMNDSNTLSSKVARKRSIGDISGPAPNATKSLRNPVTLASNATRPTKLARPNAPAASSSSSGGLGVTRPTQSSTLRASSVTTAAAMRSGSAPRSSRVSSGSALNEGASKAPVVRQPAPPVQAVNKLRSTSAGKPRPPSSVTSNTGKPAAAAKKSVTKEEDNSLELLLKAHNAKFVPVPAYEPPKYSVRDVRKWEKLTGRLWCELKPEERQAANDEIGRLKENNELV